MVPRSWIVVSTCHRKVACLFLGYVDVMQTHGAGTQLQCEVVSLLATTRAMTSHTLPMRGNRTLRGVGALRRIRANTPGVCLPSPFACARGHARIERVAICGTSACVDAHAFTPHADNAELARYNECPF